MIVVLPESDGVAIAEAVREKLGLDDNLTAQDVLDYLSALLLRVHGNADPSSLHTISIPDPEITTDQAISSLISLGVPVPTETVAVYPTGTFTEIQPTVELTVESVVINAS